MEYKQENKICQNCKKDFTIEPDDFSFYEKIKVPPPTWCPRCRMMRRALFRNVRSLYKRTCELCGKNIITMYHTNDPAPIYCHGCWHSDNWDPYSYGLEIDWSKPFLEQWNELYKVVPRFNMWKVPPLENSEYTNYSINNKNCYLAYSVSSSEDVRYSENIDYSKNCLDNLYLNSAENCYENIDCTKNYNSNFISQSRVCINSWFLFDCVNCQDCFMSSNLRNKQFVFRGQQLSKEQYEKALKRENLHSFSFTEKLKEEFDNLVKRTAIHKYADIVNSNDATGNHIQNSRNIKNSFGVFDSENIKNGIRVLKNSRDSQDLYGLAQGEMIYECVAVSYEVYNSAFSFLCNTGMSNVRYSALCLSSENLFGCTGIRKGKYSILNKQYTKEEYEKLVPKIIEHMNKMPYIDKLGRKYTYGEFFPPEFSPFGYNETIAFDLYPLKKDEADEYNFYWKSKEKRDLKIDLKSDNLPDSINDVKEDILDKAIECAHRGKCDQQCTEAFRILKEDLNFYKKFKVSIPRFCPNCRHYERLAKREPVKLWHRSCMCDKKHTHHEGKCDTEFKTSYAPDRPEIIYCERCYQQEVY